MAGIVRFLAYSYHVIEHRVHDYSEEHTHIRAYFWNVHLFPAHVSNKGREQLPSLRCVIFDIFDFEALWADGRGQIHD